MGRFDDYYETIVTNPYYSQHDRIKRKIDRLEEQIDELCTINESLTARIKHLEDKNVIPQTSSSVDTDEGDKVECGCCGHLSFKTSKFRRLMWWSPLDRCYLCPKCVDSHCLPRSIDGCSAK